MKGKVIKINCFYEWYLQCKILYVNFQFEPKYLLPLL